MEKPKSDKRMTDGINGKRTYCSEPQKTNQISMLGFPPAASGLLHATPVRPTSHSWSGHLLAACVAAAQSRKEIVTRCLRIFVLLAKGVPCWFAGKFVCA